LLRSTKSKEDEVKNRTRIIALVLLGMGAIAFQLVDGFVEPANARAQISPSRLILRKLSSSYGMIPGQVSRVCVGTASPNGAAVDWRVRFSGERGELLLELPEQHSPAGEWRCSYAARDSMDIPGELRTGRLEMVASVAVSAPRGTDASAIIASLTVLEATGGAGIQVGLADGSVKFIKNSISVNVWSLSNSQKLRVSLRSQSSGAGGDITITPAKIQIKGQGGNLILEKDLQVLADQFCYADFTYEDLVSEGLNPDQTGGLPFLVELSVVVYRTPDIPSLRDEAGTVGSNETITVGAAQSINVGSGKTEFYRLFGD
jgi:hypothetical protein